MGKLFKYKQFPKVIKVTMGIFRKSDDVLVKKETYEIVTNDPYSSVINQVWHKTDILGITASGFEWDWKKEGHPSKSYIDLVSVDNKWWQKRIRKYIQEF